MCPLATTKGLVPPVGGGIRKVMAKDVTRYIKKEVERELWARAAGRCQFHGCNRILYKSALTQETVNLAEKAHIYSFSTDGPRGWGPLIMNKSELNKLNNLILLCFDCHKKIDKEKDGGRYAAQLLQLWKSEHERRVAIVTGVDPSKKSHVILFGANIGNEGSAIQSRYADPALFPDWYPADEYPICLEMKWEGKDHDPKYWETEAKNLELGFERKVRPLMEGGGHFSIFGLAPMPLLVRLGTLFTDKTPAQVYQLHREPNQTWQWSAVAKDMEFKIIPPKSFNGSPVLLISLSAKIANERVTAVLGPAVSIWELTVEDPNNDFMKLAISCPNSELLFASCWLKYPANMATVHRCPYFQPCRCLPQLIWGVFVCRRLKCLGAFTTITTSPALL